MSLTDEVNAAIRYRNFKQAVFLLSLSQNHSYFSQKFIKTAPLDKCIYLFKYNLLLAILYFENNDFTNALDFLNANNPFLSIVDEKIPVDSKSADHISFNTYLLTFYFYKALCYYNMNKYGQASSILSSMLHKFEQRKTESNISSTFEQDCLDKILSRYFIIFDVKYIHSLIAESNIKNEQCQNAIIHFKKSLNIFSSFKFLYENLFINKDNAFKYTYSDIDNQNNIKIYEKISIEERTAFNFKKLRNDMLDFLNTPEISNALVSKHKSFINDINNTNICLNISILFLQSISKILFHNYRIDDSNSVFYFLHDTDNLPDEYKSSWSTVLWLKRDKNMLGILARKAMLYTEDFIKMNQDDSGTDFNIGVLFDGKNTNLKIENSHAWLIAANYFSACNDHNRSVICLEKAVKIEKDSYAYLLLGHEYMIRNEYDKALKTFYLTIRMNSNSYSAMYGIGSALARIYHCEFSEIEAGNPQPISEKDWDDLRAVKNNELSVPHFFRKAISIVPSNKAVRFQLIRFFVQRRELQDALKEILSFFRLSTEKNIEQNDSAAETDVLVKTLKKILLVKNNRMKFRNDYDVNVTLELVEVLSVLKEFSLANEILKILPTRSDNRYKKRKKMVEVGLATIKV